MSSGDVAEIALEDVGKVYPDGTRAVVDLDMEVADGELVVFVGPSGCGKTSALRMIAGLEDISEGTVRIGDEIVNDLPPKDRDVAMVFQNYALYPHMSAYDNMAFALKMRGIGRAEIARRVANAAEVLGLGDVLKKRPRTLSGGQRQRVAMGRAIVREPAAFLMDEPLSNLDAKLRVQMRAEIARLQRDLEVTTIYVTHDQTEAMTLGDRVAVLREGRLQQFDRPKELYERPVNLFVAEFIGSPAMNLVGADLVRVDGRAFAQLGDQRLLLDEQVLAGHPGLARREGTRVIMGIRPEDMEDASLVADAPPERRLSATVDIREDMGAEVFVHFGIAAPPVRGEDVRAAVGADELEATEQVVRKAGSLFIARVDRASGVREGGRVELAVDTRRAQFFDIPSGEAIWD
jgi:multiple sugar transport system ATP-binding protein